MICFLLNFYLIRIRTSESSKNNVNTPSINDSKTEIQISLEKFLETVDFTKLNLISLGNSTDKEEEFELIKKIKSLIYLYYYKLVCYRKEKMFNEINCNKNFFDVKKNIEENESIKNKPNDIKTNENIDSKPKYDQTNEKINNKSNDDKIKENIYSKLIDEITKPTIDNEITKHTFDNENIIKEKQVNNVKEDSLDIKELDIKNSSDFDKKNTEKKKFNLIQASKKKLGIIKEKINPTTMKDELSNSFESIPREVQNKLPAGSFYSSTADISIFQTEDSDTSNNILFDFKEKDKKKRLLFWKK